MEKKLHFRAKWNILKARTQSLAKEMPAARGVFQMQGREYQPFLPEKIGKKLENIQQVIILCYSVVFLICLFIYRAKNKTVNKIKKQIDICSKVQIEYRYYLKSHSLLKMLLELTIIYSDDLTV